MDAQANQRQYLSELLERRPADLNLFLKSMFRVEFMDDYTALKPFIDYDLLSKLIERNSHLLDAAKVEQFRKQYKAEREHNNS